MAKSIKNQMAGKLEDALTEELFAFAEYNSEEAERTGYSNYSYWKATLQVFLKNKVAVFLLIVMVSDK